MLCGEPEIAINLAGDAHSAGLRASVHHIDEDMRRPVGVVVVPERHHSGTPSSMSLRLSGECLATPGSRPQSCRARVRLSALSRACSTRLTTRCVRGLAP